MMDKIELTKLLGQNNISTEEWEKGEAKSLEHLLAEINSGEVVLNFSPETGLVRELKAVGVNVRYINELNQTYLLKEEKQIFKDGRERRRKLDASLAEKVKPNEGLMDAAKRAGSEELGIIGDFQPTVDQVIRELKDSQSYPGLKSNYQTHNFNVVLDKSQYRAEGYIEVQPDKSTYFVWELEFAN